MTLFALYSLMTLKYIFVTQPQWYGERDASMELYR
jgi:hypothetical protein